MTIFDTKSLLKYVPEEHKNAIIVAADLNGAKIIVRLANQDGHWQLQGEVGLDKLQSTHAQVESIYSW